MIRIRLRTGRVGPQGIFRPGDELDLPDEEARRLLDSMHAEPVEAPGPETASMGPGPHTATKPRPKPRKRRHGTRT